MSAELLPLTLTVRLFPRRQSGRGYAKLVVYGDTGGHYGSIQEVRVDIDVARPPRDHEELVDFLLTALATAAYG